MFSVYSLTIDHQQRQNNDVGVHFDTLKIYCRNLLQLFFHSQTECYLLSALLFYDKFYDTLLTQTVFYNLNKHIIILGKVYLLL